MSLKQIIDGHINELRSVVGIEDKEKQKIFSIRQRICISCPLKKGNTCNPKLTVTDELETIPFDNTMRLVYDKEHVNGKYYLTKDGKKVYKGCGCRLSAKQKSPSSACPAGFWGGEFNNKKTK